jgi:hypothetical protein
MAVVIPMMSRILPHGHDEPVALDETGDAFTIYL